MAEQCQAVIGYLVPRRSCTQPSVGSCSKCRTPICQEHGTIDSSGMLCPVCTHPDLWQGIDLSAQPFFNEADLQVFAEAYRTQKGQRDPWIEFT